MLNKLTLLALLILISGFANATDKKDAFKIAVNYCNCRISDTYCKQYSNMHPESKEKKSYDQIADIFKCNISQCLSYDSLDNILKRNNFSNFSSKSFAVISRIVNEEVESLSAEEAVTKIISGIYQSAEFKDILTQYSEVNNLKESLTKEISAYLSMSFGATKNPVVTDSNAEFPQVETELQIEVKRLEKMIAENKKSPFAINWLSIILMVVLSGLIYVIIILRLRDLEERTDRHRTELNSIGSKNSGDFKQPPIQNSNFNDFKRSVERNISDLNAAITILQSEIGKLSLKAQNQSDFQQSNSNLTLQVEKQQRIEILFAPIPNRDGSFNASKVTSIEDQSASFYKFTITDSLSQKATFEFLNVERAIKDATSSPELILNPVCRIKNALNQNAKRIKTVKHGIVVKQNDKWIVDQPAEIEYE